MLKLLTNKLRLNVTSKRLRSSQVTGWNIYNRLQFVMIWMFCLEHIFILDGSITWISPWHHRNIGRMSTWTWLESDSFQSKPKENWWMGLSVWLWELWDETFYMKARDMQITGHHSPALVHIETRWAILIDQLISSQFSTIKLQLFDGWKNV